MLNLEPRYYFDPSIYDRERSELFARTWQLLGPASEAAERGEYCAVEIAGHKVFAIRGEDGKLRGFRNLCRHRGARLLEEGNGRCPRSGAPIISGCGPMTVA
jgi:phenylpropionate dioxygenase-like ring-hydroxylating dioxygenase large terminal subunit